MVTLADQMWTGVLVLAAVPAVCLVAFGLFHLCRYPIWAWQRGVRIEVPWSAETPRHSAFAQRRRTRSGIGANQTPAAKCLLLCWRLEPDAKLGELLVDAVTGSARIATVALDFGLQSRGVHWIITSGEYYFRGREICGPHYAPVEANRGSALARINIAGVIDSARLLAELQAMISDPRIRHKSDAAVSYILGTTREDWVTCSSMIGRAILKQEFQPLARALRQALKERFTYGEISPADLARAAAILNLRTDEIPSRQVRVIPIFRRRERPVHELSTERPIGPDSCGSGDRRPDRYFDSGHTEDRTKPAGAIVRTL